MTSTPESSAAATAVVIKRASRACSSCRHDKIRCDSTTMIPCSNCKRKGLSEDQCIAGCSACRIARVRCEKGKPCQRCKEMQLSCVEDEISSAIPSERVDRVRLACQNCRRDNKKCDNQKPCSRCVARSEECVHVSRGPKSVKLRCDGCRANNKRCEAARPCKGCVDAQIECVSSPRKGRGVGSRVKQACTNCRRDKIRCDGVRPCNHCSRKNVECVEPACKACNRSGKADECTHRGMPEPNDSLPAASSSMQPVAVPYPPPPNMHGVPYTVAPVWYTNVPAGHQGHGPPMHMGPASHPVVYYPQIDPSLEERPTGPTVSSARDTQ